MFYRIKNYYTVIAPVLQIFFPPPPFAAYPPQDHVFLCYRFDNIDRIVYNKNVPRYKYI